MNGLKNFPRVINGDTVVGFMNSKKIKELGWMDVESLYSWYSDDPKANHLGMIQTFSAMADERMPLYENFFKIGSVIEVNGMNGKVTYDLPVTKPSGTYTSGDTSTYSEAPGIDGTIFPIELDQPYTKGDVLTYDAVHGEQVIVSEDYEVEQVGDSWVHWVTFTGTSKFSYFPAEKLKPGIQYFKIDHTLGEYSEQFSNIESPGRTGSIRCEFVLGNHRGVETFYTMYADKKQMSGATIESKDNWSQFVSDMERLGQDDLGRSLDSFFIGKLNRKTGKVDSRTVRVGSTLEYLVLLELMRLETYGNLFKKGAVINDINGTKRLNEGLIHQIRRGHRITYPMPNGITRNTFKQISAYLFGNKRQIKPMDRRIKVKAGYMASMNVLNLFREEVMMQLDGYAQLIGSTSVLPKSPVSGKNLTDLALEPIQFTRVNIPEIGIIEIEHEPALDYVPMSDRSSSGFVGDGYHRSSYTMYVEAGNPEYSNAFSNVKGDVSLYNKGAKSENIFMVRPAGESMYWGYENGRYAPDKASGIHSSMKRMGREFWAHSSSAVLALDVSRYVIIEPQF